MGEVSSGSAPFATLLVDVPAAHSWTVYQLLGDWFAWVAIALLVFAMMQMVRLRDPAHVRDFGVSTKAFGNGLKAGVIPFVRSQTGDIRAMRSLKRSLAASWPPNRNR
jgi:hypothetical protein